MPIEATIKRIGGSTFALLPPELVKRLDLHSGDVVNIEITRRGMTVDDLRKLEGIWSHLPPMTPENRPWQDRDFDA